MKQLNKVIIRGGVALTSSILFINSAFADSSTDARIQAYKANKLIPENVVLPTSTGAADSDQVVVFNKSGLSWSSGSARNIALNAISDKYKGWDLTDVSNAWGDPYILDQEEWCYSGGWAVYPSEEVKELRNYLSLVANGEITSENISPTAAQEQLLEQIAYLADFHAIGPLAGEPGNFDGFPMTGLDLTNKSINYADLSNCIGLTAAQVASMGSLGNTILPTVAFTGTEDLSTMGVTLHNTDLSKCTGITSTQIANREAWIGCKLPEVTFSGTESLQNVNFQYADLTKCSGITGAQIMSTSDLSYADLPAITFTGAESFAGKNLSGTDLSKCTGITAAQIGSASYVIGMDITSAQYNEWKSTLQSKFNGKYVFVDGVKTVIQ